jgi:hypothetical protein
MSDDDEKAAREYADRITDYGVGRVSRQAVTDAYLAGIAYGRANEREACIRIVRDHFRNDATSPDAHGAPCEMIIEGTIRARAEDADRPPEGTT